MKKLFIFSILSAISLYSVAQCSSGEVQAFVKVSTDTYGYEVYWELLPDGNNCGAGTIFAGGNATQVGCGGAGDQDANTSSGYSNNTTITEGPWCLTEGATYKVVAIDDWADGGTNFSVEVAGFAVANYSATGGNESFTFVASAPTLTDASVEAITTSGFSVLPDVDVSVSIKNNGQTNINTIKLAYSIDGSNVGTETFNGLSVIFGSTEEITFTAPWMPAATGNYSLEVTILEVNGGADDDNANNSATKSIDVTEGVPTIVDNYITYSDSNTTTTIADGSDGVATPRDLDFHPDLGGYELWVINKGTAGTGGSTVTIFDAGKSTQTIDDRQDGNARHFMSLPTAIAFGENTNFATSPGVQDANFAPGGAGTFTGPTLWSSDMSIYAVIGSIPTQAVNGSHLDMLHGSPFSMGIAHEVDNVYWVFDSHNEELVRYDFVAPHAPGGEYHGDAIVRRYKEIQLTRANDNVPSHMVLDKETGWLYIADNDNKQVLRVNTNSGNVKGSLPLINEQLAEHSEVENVTWEVYITGLTDPSGIEVIGDRLLVGDHTTGNIGVYDISGANASLVGEFSTGATELMGIKVGPQGFVWYVDAGANEVNKIETYVPEDTTQPVGIISVLEQEDFQVYPQPANNLLVINTSVSDNDFNTARIINMVGQAVITEPFVTKTMRLDLSSLPAGVYVVELIGNTDAARKSIQILR